MTEWFELSDADRAVLEAAKELGYLWSERSTPYRVDLAWAEWCREQRKPCVFVHPHERLRNRVEVKVSTPPGVLGVPRDGGRERTSIGCHGVGVVAQGDVPRDEGRERTHPRIRPGSSRGTRTMGPARGLGGVRLPKVNCYIDNLVQA